MSEFVEIQMNKRCVARPITSYINVHERVFDTSEPSEKLHRLENLKGMIGASVNMALKDKSCCSDDNFLNRFLYARKFHCEDALLLLINYMTYKNHNKVILHNINIFDDRIQCCLRDGNPAVLKQRDRRGRKIITFAAANWETNKCSLEDVYRAFLLSLDILLENVENQALGFVIIVDWTNFTYKQSTHLSPKTLKLMIEGLQESMPAKFKGIHFIAQPWYVDIALAVIKPFLIDKIKERFIVHGLNLTTLHNMINKDVLPPDLGGEGPSTNTLDWYHYLLESSQSTQSPNTYRLLEATVYSKAPLKTASTCESLTS